MFGAASLQGEPRPGRRRFGVPPGGAFDQTSYRLANALAGNYGGELCLELGFGTGVAISEGHGRLAVVGGEAILDAQVMKSGSAFDILPGQKLTLSLPARCRSYLAILGGWALSSDISNARTLVGEQNTYTPRGIAVLPELGHEMAEKILLRFVGERSDVLSATCSVSQRLDRGGIRLIGPKLPSNENLVSEPTVIGVIQATSEGLIVHGPDGPTVGGYEKFGVVCSADIDCLGQLRPGDQVKFSVVSSDEAKELRKEREEIVRKLVDVARASG